MLTPNYTGNVSSDSTISSALSNGWYVSTPDYEGFNASYTNGVQSGQALLDSIRAALNSKSITGLDSDATYAITGYSGGALASEWATELQPCYAPELQIAGAALGGLTPNVTSVLFTVNETPYAGLSPPGILGLSSQDPEFRSLIETLLVPLKAPLFNQASMQCVDQDIVTYLDQDITSYFVDGAVTFTLPNVTEFTNTYGVMGLRDTPTVPLYVYKGVQDQISVVADTDNLVDKYCTAGAAVQYVRSQSSDHITEESNGQPAAFAWLEARLDGVPVMSGCNITTIA